MVKLLKIIFAELTKSCVISQTPIYVCVFVLRGQQQRTAAWREETRSWPLTGRLWKASRTKKQLASWKGPKELWRSLCCHRHTHGNTHHLRYSSYTFSLKVNPHLQRLKLWSSNTPRRCDQATSHAKIWLKSPDVHLWNYAHKSINIVTLINVKKRIAHCSFSTLWSTQGCCQKTYVSW